MKPTKQEIIAGLELTLAVLEAVPEQGIPVGHMYAVVMEALDLGKYNTMIGVLVKEGALEQNGMHYLTRGRKYERARHTLAHVIALMEEVQL